MATATRVERAERTAARLVEYVRPVRIKGVGGPTGSHVSTETLTIEFDRSFVYVTEIGKGSIAVPMPNVVRIELP